MTQREAKGKRERAARGKGGGGKRLRARAKRRKMGERACGARARRRRRPGSGVSGGRRPQAGPYRRQRGGLRGRGLTGSSKISDVGWQAKAIGTP